MFRGELASQSDMHLEAINSDGPELRWCIFTKGKRAPIAKIIVDTRPRKVQDATYEPTAHIVNVHVRPEYRGKRLGEHLVRLAQSAMKANGFTWLTLEAEENVELHGKLVGLYERCGFEIHPPAEHFPLEYNGDECYRKVPMRCNLQAMILDECFPAPTSSSAPSAATTTTTTAPIEIPSSRFESALFVGEMKREALSLLQSTPLNLSISVAMDWIDQHLAPGAMEAAIRTGLLLRSRGHPDWMELAGYLRFVGRIQEKWTSWHSPFMIHVSGDSPAEAERQSDDEEEEPVVRNPMAKSGPLPGELCTSNIASRFIDPERYAQEGVEEAMMTWTPNEFAYLALSLGDRCSAPREMAQVLRYAYCDAWLSTDSFSYLESYGDSDLKKLAVEFRQALNDADGMEMLDLNTIEEGRARVSELVDKYASEVRML